MKKCKEFRLILEYIGVKGLILFVRLLPWSLAIKFGEFLGLTITLLIPKRRKRAVKDVLKAFPEMSRKEAQAITKESFINIGRMTAEFIKAAHMPKEKVLEKVELNNFDVLLNHIETGKGGILHLGHFVNWEFLGLWIGYAAKKVAFVAKPQNNPYVDKEITKMRTLSGAVPISSRNSFFSCFKLLKKGYLISVLSDQSVYSSGMYMNFLGRPAEVGAMSAVLALKMDVPVFPVRINRVKGKIVMTLEDTILPPQVPYSEQAIYDFTRVLMNKYEEWIKADPSSWLWGHNRWKRENKSLQKMREQAERGLK